jgi:antitoxin MazE
MRTTLRKIGNSRGILIPAALLAECGVVDEIDLRLEGKTIVIAAVRPAREAWYQGFSAEHDDDTWDGLTQDLDSTDWVW